MNIPKYLYEADFYTIDKYYRKKSRILLIKSLFSKKALKEYEDFRFQIWLLLNPEVYEERMNYYDNW